MISFIKKNPIISLSLALHLIVPFFAIGYHNSDEHFYSIEFALFKMGISDYMPTSWEYQSQIRPFSLPFVFYVIGSFLKSLGVDYVLTLSTFFRFVSSMLGFFSLFYFIEDWKKRYSISKNLEWVFYLAWPLIMFHSRNNSENWSTIFFLFGASLFLRNKNNFLTGLVLGLSFFFRFQLGFLILPIFWFKRKELGSLSVITLGILTTCALMVLVDRWGYGSWTLTPYNYFMVNLVQDKVNSFGVSPWWYYFYLGLVKLLPFWGIGILGSIAWGIKSKNQEFKEILIWIMPFLLVHMLIGHKELRFIYPIMPFCMILVARFFGELKDSWQKVFLWGNLLALPILFMPQQKRFKIYDYVFKNTEIKTLYYATEASPLHIKSIMRKDLVTKDFKEYDGNGPFWVITHKYREYEAVEKDYSCEIKKEIYPSWVRKFNIGNWVSRASTWVLGYCTHKSNN
jgi:phosphatidylinositol glycan class B